VRRVRALGADEHREFGALVDADPYVNAVVAARLRACRGLDPARLGGTVLGVRTPTWRLSAAVLHGGTLLPVGGDHPDWAALAADLTARHRVCSSIIGRADVVASLWERLDPYWGPARAVRREQPLLLTSRPGAAVRADPRVRVVRPDEIDSYLGAAAAMFTEELGVTPDQAIGAREYRARVAGVLRDGRAFGLVDADGRFVFKADLGAVTDRTCQVQGVWVRPDSRGRGLGTAALAAVLARALTLAPTVSLYVNDFNEPARRMYARLGLRQAATLSTVLF
jgi:predicted GNAT family acetyltransferase